MPPKIRVVKKTVSKAKPTTAKQRKTETGDPLQQSLSSIDLGENRRLSSEQIKTLLSLKFPNENKIITKENPQLLIDIIDLLRRLPFQKVVTYLENAKNPSEAVLNSPLLENERERVRLELDNMQTRIQAEKGEHVCDKCHSREVLVIHKQLRGADEPMSSLIRCLGCGKGWRVD